MNSSAQHHDREMLFEIADLLPSKEDQWKAVLQNLGIDLELSEDQQAERAKRLIEKRILDGIALFKNRDSCDAEVRRAVVDILMNILSVRPRAVEC